MMDCPPQSPDLSLIEQIWGWSWKINWTDLLKGKPPLAGVAEERCAAVTAAQGGRSKYSS